MSQGISQDVPIAVSDSNALDAGLRGVSHDMLHRGVSRSVSLSNRNTKTDDWGKRPTWNRGFLAVKRLADIVFSAAWLVAFSWLYLIVAIAIKIDDPKGTVFFKQKRVGRNGREFTMLKFRSMYSDAEERLKDLAKHNEKDGPVFKMKNDPRVTRVGRFIRKTSIDEIPQFINVLRGDMSIVGPRPALSREVAQYDEWQRRRLQVKPGLTCYWQTSPSRDDVSFDDWMSMDLQYIEDASVATDLKLMVRTAGVMLTGQGE